MRVCFFEVSKSQVSDKYLKLKMQHLSEFYMSFIDMKQPSEQSRTCFSFHSLSSTANFEPATCSCTHLVMDVGLTGVAPDRQVSKAKNQRVTGHLAMGHHVLIYKAPTQHLHRK